MNRRRLPRPGGGASPGGLSGPEHGGPASTSSDPAHSDAHAAVHDPTVEFRAWLIERMRRDGLSPSALARRSGVHRTTVTRLVNGERGVTLDTALRILRAVDAAPVKPRTASPVTASHAEARLRTLLRSEPIADDEVVEHLVAEFRRLRGS